MWDILRDLHWVIVTLIVRIFFLFAPFSQVEKDFNLGGSALDEAREMAQAGNCQAMVVSSPAIWFFGILAESQRQCQAGVNPLYVAVASIGIGAVMFIGFKIPTLLYRGWFPYVWLVLLTILDGFVQFRYLLVAQGMCQTSRIQP